MKKRIKKLLSLVLVAFILAGTTPLSGFVGLEIPDILDLFVTKAVAATYTSGDWEYTVNNNEATLTKYNGTATNITLPTALDGISVKHIGASLFKDNTKIISVVIPEGFLTIGDSAFLKCTYLKTVSIPKSIKQIGTSWLSGSSFGECIRLENLTLTEGGTAEVKINPATFAGCTALRNVTIPSNYKTIGGSAFKDCTSLETVIIKSNGDPYFERVIEGSAFENCSSLTIIHIPKEFVGIADYAFRNTSDSLVICSTTSDCTAKTYAQENGITFRVCDGTHATPVVKSYTLSYNANGGSGAPSSQVNSATYTIPATIPTRNGYVFIGWSTSNTATTATYLSGDIVTLSANTTLYAVWQVDIVEDPDDSVILTVISIKPPSRTTIDYGDSIILHAELGKDLAEGERIEWSADNGNFSYDVSSDGKTCTITPKSSGETVFTVKVIDKDDNVVSEDTQEMSSNAGFFTKIIAFFKKLFGATKIFTSGIEF